MAGAFATSLSSYFFIIIAAQHHGKCYSITWMTIVVIGFLLIYRKQYGWGALLTMLFTYIGFFLHPQMSYYICLMIGIFFFATSKSNGEKDYFLGGRSMGPWVTAMSAQASDMSAWLLMGLPGSIIAFGLGQAWIGIGLAIGTALNWIIVAKRLRKFSKAAGDAITLPQYLTNRFLAKSSALKIICAVVFLISFTIYVASAFSAGTGSLLFTI